MGDQQATSHKMIVVPAQLLDVLSKSSMGVARVLLCIARITLDPNTGQQVREAEVSLTSLARRTQLGRRTVARAVKQAVEAGYLVKKSDVHISRYRLKLSHRG